MKEKEFDHIIKQKLNAIEDAPPAYMWERIANNIPAATSTTSVGWSTSIKLTLLAASIIIIGTLSFLLFHNQTPPVKRSISENVKFSNNHYLLKHRQLSIKTIDSDIINQNVNHQNKTSVRVNQKNIALQQKVSIAAKEAVTIKSSSPAANKFDQEFDKLAVVQNSGSIKKTESHKQPVKTPDDGTATNSENHTVDNKLAVVPTIEESTNLGNENTELPKNEAPNKTLEEQSSKENIVQRENQKTGEIREATATEKSVAVTETQAPKSIDAVAAQQEAKTIKEDPKNRQLDKYSIGLHYGPEFMNVNGLKLTDQGFDFSFNYQNVNFILQTGLGLRLSQDKVAYNMKYKRWDYLETQVRFDSAVFVLDQNGNPILQPVNPYYEEVYDSLTHTYHATATEQNVMIQIPLLVGYQVDFKKFGYFIKGGIRYSLVVYTNTKDLLELDEQSKLVNMSYPTQTRAKSNIDYEMSVGGLYKLNKNFQIQAEFFGRYYHYSIYEENPPSGIHPWSLSGRIGLVYILK